MSLNLLSSLTPVSEPRGDLPLKPDSISSTKASALLTIAKKALTPYEIATFNPSFKERVTLPNFEKPFLEAKISELMQALEERDWLADIFEKDPSYPYYALEALKAERLTLEQFGTILIYYSLTEIFETYDILNIPVFSNTGIDPIVKEILFQSLCVLSHSAYNLPQEKFEQFIEALKQKPLSEQQIFLIPAPEPFYSCVDKEDSISQAVRRRGVNILSHLRDSYSDPIDKTSYLLVAPIGMKQLYLEMKFKYPVKIHPVIGISPLSSIKENGLTGTRDFGLPFPGLDLPKEVDERFCSFSAHFGYHDFYHAIRCSLIPDGQRKGCIRISEKVREVQLELAEDFQNLNGLTVQQEFDDEGIQAYLSQLYSKLIDMEFTGYSKANESKDLDILFWKNINNEFLNALSKAKKGQEQQNLFIYNQIVKHGVFERIASKIFEEKEFLRKEYGLSFKAIISAKEEILNRLKTPSVKVLLNDHQNHQAFERYKERHVIFTLSQKYSENKG